MNNFLEEKFYNPTRGELTFPDIIKEMRSYMSEKPEKLYDIIVGCDSASDVKPRFPVVIVILRIGGGGRFFFKKIEYKDRKFYSWKQRVLEEVLLSCELALNLKESLEKELGDTEYAYQFRYIHADVGETGDTKDMIREVTGLIKGNGFEPVIKPHSFVASTVADRLCV